MKKSQTRQLYEKMVDFKRFAVLLLAAGVFFYLGVIIPTGRKTTFDTNILIISSTAFIAVSLLLFVQVKKCRARLLELGEEDDYLKK